MDDGALAQAITNITKYARAIQTRFLESKGLTWEQMRAIPKSQRPAIQAEYQDWLKTNYTTELEHFKMLGLPDFVAVFHDLRTNRWHPVNFAIYPLPGSAPGTRIKSMSHHTEGFASEAEAIAHLDTIDKRCTQYGSTKPVRLRPLIYITRSRETDPANAFVSVLVVTNEGAVAV